MQNQPGPKASSSKISEQAMGAMEAALSSMQVNPAQSQVTNNPLAAPARYLGFSSIVDNMEATLSYLFVSDGNDEPRSQNLALDEALEMDWAEDGVKDHHPHHRLPGGNRKRPPSECSEDG
ncbi:hypothetical protein GALMADRAFT_208657 [Galerina marginata CBS 339.88]|uniref:Uncharacterized protein n=1 Tax=Galerina marginata (strain CBS 339.88) TaxID=685588 RepID=A0A067TH07_GALM3|nr:hypothetical protein GALMADRAFT_208657 [Galerina marginata CBS 339.88]